MFWAVCAQLVIPWMLDSDWCLYRYGFQRAQEDAQADACQATQAWLEGLQDAVTMQKGNRSMPLRNGSGWSQKTPTAVSWWGTSVRDAHNNDWLALQRASLILFGGFSTMSWRHCQVSTLCSQYQNLQVTYGNSIIILWTFYLKTAGIKTNLPGRPYLIFKA